MKISFCTTCMNRVEHLKQTLPRNIEDNPPGDGLEIEFVVLNYNSSDDMDRWMKTEMRNHIESGLIRYARTPDPKHFNMSHAKNMSHRLATGDVLCNLDADNYLGKGFARFIADIYEQNPNVVMNPSQAAGLNALFNDKGFFGRVTIARIMFMAIGGHAEGFKSWGGEEVDMLRRAKGYGALHLRFENPEFLKVIGHSNEERIKNWDNPNGQKQALAEIAQKQDPSSILQKIALAFKIAGSRIQANNGGEFGCGNVFLGLNEEKYVLGAAEVPKLPESYRVVRGLPELVRGRLAPRVIGGTLQDSPGEPKILSPS